jgi:hypothetical protein
LGKMLERLFEVCEQKTWLRESCTKVICQVIDIMPETGLKEVEKYTGLNGTLEDLVIKYALYKRTGLKNPLDWDMEVLGKVLRQETPGKGGAWKKGLHSVWPLFIEELVTGDIIKLKEFWDVVVDKGMFSENSSSERKYTGMQALTFILPSLSSDQYKFVFGEKFSRCWINHLSGPDRTLHNAAKQIVQTCTTIADVKNATAMLKVILSLSLNFDKLTGTKLVASLMACNPDESIDVLSEYCNGASNQDQIALFDYSAGVIKQKQYRTKAEAKKILKYLMDAVYRNRSGDLMKQRLMAVLASMPIEKWTRHAVVRLHKDYRKKSKIEHKAYKAMESCHKVL